MIYLAQSQDESMKKRRTESLIDALRSKKCLSLFIEVASLCNLRCDFCDFQKGKFRKKKGLMTSATVDKICAMLQKTEMSLHNINFYVHGEPLCNPDLANIVRKVRSVTQADKYKVVTNGVLLTPEKCAELVDAGVNSIKISLDAGTRERFLELKGVDAFDKVYENTLFAIDYMSQSCPDGDLVIKTCTPMDGGAVDSRDKDDVLSLFGDICKNSENIHVEVVEEYSWHTSGEPNLASCEAPFTQCVVSYDGVVSGCCVDTDYALEVGNVLDAERLEDIIYGKKMKALRKSMLGLTGGGVPKYCRTCGGRTCVDVSERIKDIVQYI